MLKRRKPSRSGIARNPDRIRSPAHRAWVRGHICCASSSTTTGDRIRCDGPIECAHVRIGTDGGTGIKPSDIWTVPLCKAHHAEQHAIGEPAFERKYQINLKRIAEDLARKSKALKRLAHERRILEEEIGA